MPGRKVPNRQLFLTPCLFGGDPSTTVRRRSDLYFDPVFRAAGGKFTRRSRRAHRFNKQSADSPGNKLLPTRSVAATTRNHETMSHNREPPFRPSRPHTSGLAHALQVPSL